MQNKLILYIGRLDIPNDAASLRAYHVAKILRKIDYQVTFVSNKRKKINTEVAVYYDNFQYVFTNRYTKKTIYSSLKNAYELISSVNTYKAVIKMCQVNKPYAIILYNDLYPLTKKLLKYCKNNNIKIIADVTEWYEKRKYQKFGDKIIPYDTNKRITKMDKKLDSAITISQYLYHYYSTIGLKAIKIPPLCDVQKEYRIQKYNYYDTRIINLVYAGTPGQKDILIPIFDALEKINDINVKFRLDLVGINENDVYDMWKKCNLVKVGIVAHGHVAHEDALEIVKRADFGVLLRERKRYAKAGYSTKFVECMSNGVAMICNNVGGADIEITDKMNGFVISNYGIDEVRSVMEKIISMTEEEVCNIRRNAHEFALKHYCEDLYAEALKDFLND